jgi:RND family efflux transporter MFP subunit
MKHLFVLSLIVLIITACDSNKGARQKSSDGHAHVSDEVHQLTLFTDKSEFFVEYPGLIINKESELAVHLTNLENYQPYNDGTVRVLLENSGGKAQEEYISEPDVPGIFRVSITPETPGESSIHFEFTREGISEKSGSHHVWVARDDHDPEPEESHEVSQDGIRFTKEQAWRSDFAVTRLSPVPFSGIIKAGGEILAMPRERHLITARTSGIVHYSKNDLVAGADVYGGEELMTIQGQDLARDNIAVQYAAAEARFEQSHSEYERRLKLFREGATSERQFIETRSKYKTDSIRYNNIKQSYSRGGLKIIAPIDGHIHELKVSQGEFVETGHLIATVSSERRLLLKADVPQQYFHRIQNIVSTNFKTSYNNKVWDLKDFKGKLLAIGSSVAENNQYLPVYFEAQNNGQLLEGAFAEFYLKTRILENCVVVPVEAVLEEQGTYYVYVQVTGEIFRKQEIVTGDLDGFGYRVTGGLSVGDRIVTRGGMLLKTASMSTSLSGHSHQH